MQKRLISMTLFAALWPLSAAVAAEGQSFGTWLTDDEKAKVELYECGESICSKIVWLKEPNDEKGKPYRDQLNPDPKLRGRAIMGMDILQNTKKISDKAWSGEIYSPEDGKAYYLKHIALSSPKQVEIRGCLSSGWPCRTKYWTRTEPVQEAATPQVASKRPAPEAPPRAVAAAPAPAPQRQASAAPVPSAPQPAPEPRQAYTPPPAPQPTYTPPPAPQQQAYTPPPAPQPQRQAAVTPPPPVYSPPAPTYTPPRTPEPTARRASPETTAALPRAMAVAPNEPRAYHVQVLARQTQQDALQAYSEMQQRYPHLLGNISPNVQMADLGSKGVWYRVRVGPIGEQASAVNFCNKLKSEGADCIVREP